MSTCEIVRAIDAEYKAKCGVARAAYEKRMKPARKWVADARANLKRMEEALAAHQEQAAEEEQAAITEARLWREESIRAVKGKPPFKLSDVAAVRAGVGDRRPKVSLPTLSCLEERA